MPLLPENRPACLCTLYNPMTFVCEDSVFIILSHYVDAPLLVEAHFQTTLFVLIVGPQTYWQTVPSGKD